MPRYLVHRFLTQRIPTHAHGALSQPIRDRAEWVTAVASHQLALYQVTSRVLDRLFSYPERHNLSRLAFPIHFAGACCHPRHTDGLSGPSRSHIVWCLWGFCSIRSWPSACRTPNDANSPFGGREFVAWRAHVRVSGLTCAISPMRAEALPWCQVDDARRHQHGRNAWSMWRCCAASTSVAKIRSS